MLPPVHVPIRRPAAGRRAERPEHEHARPAPAGAVRRRHARRCRSNCAPRPPSVLGLAIDFRQTNGEGELVSWVQECRGRAAGIVINPAGYTTTSIALMDALLATDLPVIEVHVTNIHRREEFRQHSYVSKVAVGVICRPGRARLRPGAAGHGRTSWRPAHDAAFRSIPMRSAPGRRADRNRPVGDRDRREGQPHPRGARAPRAPSRCRRAGRRRSRPRCRAAQATRRPRPTSRRIPAP